MLKNHQRNSILTDTDIFERYTGINKRIVLSHTLMLKNLFTIFTLLLISVTCTVTVIAQSQNEAEDTLLPEINPQDIEIRSQFQARFPGLNRQPILGFNPRPRVFQLDPDRMPFIEDEETILASLPIGQLDRPEPPQYNPLGYATPKYMFLRAGIGSDITPEADLFAVGKINDNHWISGNLRFHSSDGYEENVPTSYRYVNASVQSYNRLTENIKLRSEVGALSNFNHFLQLDTDLEELLNVNSRMNVNGFNAAVEVEQAKTSLTGIQVSASGFVNDFSYDSGLIQLDGTGASEWSSQLQGEYSRLGNNLNEVQRVRLQTTLGSINLIDSISSSWSVSELSAHYERLFNYNTDVKASAGVSLVTDSGENAVVYFTPEVEIKHTVFRGLALRAKAFGSANHQTLLDIQQENRFYDFSGNLKHQYTMAGLAEVHLEPFYGTKIMGGVSFQDVKNFLYYSRVNNPFNMGTINEGYYTAAFGDATIFKVYGRFTQDLKADVFWISAEGHWQRPKLSGSNNNIPFTENLSLSSTVSFRPINELLIEGWGEFTSGRENHNQESLSSYVTIGSRFEISITDKFGVYGKLLNLLDENYEYWDGYREHGFRGFVGFTVLL